MEKIQNYKEELFTILNDYSKLIHKHLFRNKKSGGFTEERKVALLNTVKEIMKKALIFSKNFKGTPSHPHKKSGFYNQAF